MMKCKFFTVADPETGSGAGLTPESGIRNRFFLISDPGSQTFIFESLPTIFWVKITTILVNLINYFFLYQLRNKIIINFVIFAATKKLRIKKILPPLLLLLVDSDSRDSGLGMDKKSGSEIRFKHPLFTGSMTPVLCHLTRV
jgi:hypothetical protein